MNEQSRQAKWAQAQKERMRIILGGKCKYCGTRNNLTFDCIVPRGGAHHSLGSVGRISFYRKEMRAGNLQLLCAFHNSQKQAKLEPKYTPFQEVKVSFW